jgi:uncharacterized protein
MANTRKRKQTASVKNLRRSHGIRGERGVRGDGWENVTTGLGVSGRDKRLGSTFAPDSISQDVADDLWEGDDMLARAVETPIDEMLREGFKVKVEEIDGEDPEAGPDEAEEEKEPDPKPAPLKTDFIPEDPDEDAEEDLEEGDPDEDLPAAAPKKKDESKDAKKIADGLDSEFTRLNVVELLREAGYFSRAFGGGAILLGSVDGSEDLSKPLNEEKIDEIKELSVRTPKELIPKSYYNDVKKPKYGQIATYYLVPLDSPPGDVTLATMPVVHESRVVRIDGVRTTRRKRLLGINPGWDKSIFVRIAQIAADFQHSFQGAAILVQDFAPATLKIKGLARILASKRVGTDGGVGERAAALALCKSIARVAIIDAEEEYKRETVSVTGLAELLDKMALRYSAAIRMPVTKLMGESPAGLNATGNSDIRWWYDQLRADQKRIFLPVLMRLAKLVFLAKQGPTKGRVPKKFTFEFGELHQLTALEKEDLRKKVAERDKIYVDMGAVTPEEIARSRFGPNGWSAETVVDLELREAMASDEQHQRERLGEPSEQDKELAEAEIEGAKKGQPPGQPPLGKGGPPGKPKKGNPFGAK